MNAGKNDTSTVQAYHVLASITYATNPAEAIGYGKKGIAISQQLGYKKGQGSCLLITAFSYAQTGNYQNAVTTITDGIFVYRNIAEPRALTLCYSQRADYYKQLRMYKKALADCDTVLILRGINSSSGTVASIMQTMGEIHILQGNPARGIGYFQKAIAQYRKVGNSIKIADLLFEQGKAYQSMKNTPAAIASYRSAIKTTDSIGHTYRQSSYYSYLSDVYLQSGQNQKAEEAAKQAISYASMTANAPQKAAGYLRMAAVNKQDENYEQAANWARRAKAIADSAKDLKIAAEANRLLAEVLYEQDNYKAAFLLEQQGRQQEDSLDRERYDIALADMQTRFEVKEKNNEIERLNTAKKLTEQKLTQQRIVAGFSIILIAAMAGGVALFISRKNLKQKIQQMELRNQIAADLHDEVGSSLTSINLLGQMAMQQLPQDNASHSMLKKLSDNARETVDKMSDIVWMIKPADNEAQNLVERLENFVQEISASANITAVLNLAVLGKLPLDASQRKDIYLICREAVNNAVKYAHAKNISLSAQKKPDGLAITIADDGLGFDTAATPKGNGIINMQQRAAAMGGSLLITSHSNGTTIELNVPS